jgi:hypothetical protein
MQFQIRAKDQSVPPVRIAWIPWIPIGIGVRGAEPRRTKPDRVEAKEKAVVMTAEETMVTNEEPAVAKKTVIAIAALTGSRARAAAKNQWEACDFFRGYNSIGNQICVWSCLACENADAAFPAGHSRLSGSGFWSTLDIPALSLECRKSCSCRASRP